MRDAAAEPRKSDPARTPAVLRVRRIGIDTYREPVVYMRRDCHVCRSEGFEAQARIHVQGARASVSASGIHPLEGTAAGEVPFASARRAQPASLAAEGT